MLSPGADLSREKTSRSKTLQSQYPQNTTVEIAAVFKYILVTFLNPSVLTPNDNETITSFHNSQQISESVLPKPFQSLLLSNEPGIVEQFPPSQYEIIEITSNVDLSNATAVIGPDGDISFTFPSENHLNTPDEPHSNHDSPKFDSHSLFPNYTCRNSNMDVSNLSCTPDFDSFTSFSVGVSPTSEKGWLDSTFSDCSTVNTKDPDFSSKDLLDPLNPLGDMWPRRRSELAKTRSINSTSSAGSEYVDESQAPQRKHSSKRVTFADITEEFDSEDWEERAREYRIQKKMGRKTVFTKLQLATSPSSIDSWSSEERTSSKWGLKKTAKSFKSFFKTNHGNTPPDSPLGFRVNDLNLEDIGSEVSSRRSSYFVNSNSDLNKESNEHTEENPKNYDYENNVDKLNTKDVHIGINMLENRLGDSTLDDVDNLKAEINDAFKMLDILSSGNHGLFENWSVELGSAKAS
ncbi:hypothetical protein HK096_003875 [Nowakowskiella sp. JEL0078]|nr:hypothetical protein HK096_003875 [Nowakowskiella sp. JEL0078]